MPTDDEVQRLREVYRNYRESRVVQARWSGTNPGNQAIIQERTRVLRQMLQASDFPSLADCRVLDIGCGSGQMLASFMRWGALPYNLYGIDLLPNAASQEFVCNVSPLMSILNRRLQKRSCEPVLGCHR
jgi:2-polyprenyl-3-methyl-5-hydroxy-6-metoxy-1,4-benzoquinol methylase